MSEIIYNNNEEQKTNIEWFLPCKCKECVCYWRTFKEVKLN